MNISTLSSFTLILLLGLSACQTNQSGPSFQLIWADEFEYSGKPDSTKWSYNTGGHGWGNNEHQNYTDRIENSEVKDGKLFINARKEKYNDKEYTSARLITLDTGGHWKYGKIEAKIKLPFGQGIWPAFWMLGKNIQEVSWPACGEIDIMEMIGGQGRENTIHGTAHWKNSEGKHTYIGNDTTLTDGTFADDFHLYSVIWEPEKISWYLDGNQYYELAITDTSMTEFHEEFFILLNLAVGGNWPKYPDETTTFPQTMEVDYVRVYQRSGEGNIKP